MGAIENEDKRGGAFLSSFQCDFLQFVEGPFDVQQRGGVSRSADTEQAADITVYLLSEPISHFDEGRMNGNGSLLVEFEVKGFSKPDPEDLQISMGFEHSTAVTIDLAHGFQEH